MKDRYYRAIKIAIKILIKIFFDLLRKNLLRKIAPVLHANLQNSDLKKNYIGKGPVIRKKRSSEKKCAAPPYKPDHRNRKVVV